MPEFLKYQVCALKSKLVYVIICGAGFAVCFGVGIYFGVKSETLLFSDAVCGFYDMLFLRGGSVWGYAFSKLLGGLGVLVIVALSGLLPWLLPVHVCFIAYSAFVSGAALIGFFGELSVIGVSFYFLVIFTSTIVRCFSIIILSASLLCYNDERRLCNRRLAWGSVAVLFAVSFVIYLAAVVFECLMIMLVVRPINVFF